MSFLHDGELSGHTLEIRDISMSEETGNIIPSSIDGNIEMDSDENGTSIVRIYSSGLDEGNIAETITHELNLHGATHQDQIQGNGSPTAKDDHKAIRDKDSKSKGYNSYKSVRNEITKKNPSYKEAFEKKEKFYRKEYSDL